MTELKNLQGLVICILMSYCLGTAAINSWDPKSRCKDQIIEDFRGSYKDLRETSRRIAPGDPHVVFSGHPAGTISNESSSLIKKSEGFWVWANVAQNLINHRGIHESIAETMS